MIKIKRRRQSTADECETQGLHAIVCVLQIVEVTALVVIYLSTVAPPKAGLIHKESEGGWTSLAEAQYLLGRPC